MGSILLRGASAAVAGILALGVQGPQPAADVRAAQGNQARAANLRARGVELGYNLDHAAALDAFQEAIAADPTHHSAYRLVAATLWIQLLFSQGAVTAEDFLGQASNAGPSSRPKVAGLDSRFRESLNKAIALAETRLRERGQSDVDAHYQIGAAYGVLATYTATAEGSRFASVSGMSITPMSGVFQRFRRNLELAEKEAEKT